MVCDYFGEASGPVCRARSEKGLVIPTIMEETRFCLTDRFRDCVHWQDCTAAKKELSGRRGGGSANGPGSAWTFGP